MVQLFYCKPTQTYGKLKSYQYRPINGTASDVAGTSSAISSMNIEKAKKTDNPRVIFSPETGGSQKVIMFKVDSIAQGTMMLNK